MSRKFTVRIDRVEDGQESSSLIEIPDSHEMKELIQGHIISQLKQDKAIWAVKAFRDYTGCSLLAAKHAVDLLRKQAKDHKQELGDKIANLEWFLSEKEKQVDSLEESLREYEAENKALENVRDGQGEELERLKAEITRGIEARQSMANEIDSLNEELRNLRS
jgi:chromosome segregation ATPase